ncbi:MAG: hypothetical protein CR972_00630 [Candidatus Moraniibacteriota bacterium]|nr:MAG: hypothetical protein CR972_00630 [Candidatus Moranbacteria bacterium]
MFNLLTASQKILGMNARNLTYIRPHNLKRAKRLADEKITSKMLLKKNGVPVPRLIAQISSRRTLENFDWSILPPSFVLKPNRGLGGDGIVVVYGRKKGTTDTWIRSNGSTITIDDLKTHVRHILDGEFSLSNTPDMAFFEERLKLSKEFRPYAYKGIPDIRIIIYNKVPVMAMLRLPTKESGGKANLQQGGIGVGIDMARGITTTAVQGKSKVVEYVPGTRLLLSGIKIPYWDEMLTLAIKAQEASGLGFLGADIAIDRDNGPVFLELNARPGLSIQVANMAGLKKRLERVEGLKIKTAVRGARVGKNLFGGEIEEDLENTSGKRVIGSVEDVQIVSRDGKTKIDTQAKIDTGAYSTSIDTELARTLGFGHVVDAFAEINIKKEFGTVTKKGQGLGKKIEKKYKNNIPDLADIAVTWSSSGVTIRPMIRIKFIMDKKTIATRVNIVDRSDLNYDMIIGKRNLRQFLVDVSK